MTGFWNLIFCGGLTLFGLGLWLFSPGLALTATGGLLLIVWFIALSNAAKAKGR